MERGKVSSSGRGGKSKAPQHPQDIFALGSKSTVPVSRDAEKRSIHKPTTSAVDRKRDASTFGAPTSSKRSRLDSPAEIVSGTSLEVDPVDLVSNVLQALDTHNSDKLLGLLTGSIRLLKSQRSKPDPILCMSMLYLTKIRPNMFAHETVSQSLCSLLKREQGAAFKSKGNPLVFVLACNMLYAAHRDNNNWPDTFIKVYIEDALNERWWVECSWCKCLVDNIVTAFNTKPPLPDLIPADSTLDTMSPSGSGSPLMGSTDEDIDISGLDYSVSPRYSASYESVEALVLEAIKDQIQRRAAPDTIGKGFLKLLTATCGFPEIRMIAASRLEGWLHSGKLWRAAQELLAGVCCNTTATAARDHEVLAQLARMRLKTKPLLNTYLCCLREMVSASPAILRIVVTHTIYNELSNVRSPNNMAVLTSLIQSQPLLVPQAMAETYQELLMRTEEFLRPLRTLTRECVRAARSDAAQALLPLARALTTPPPHEPEQEVRERAFTSLADLFCLCCLLTASHAKHLPEYKQQIHCIQAAAVDWMIDVAVQIYRPSRLEYQHALHKIMFLEAAEVYSKVDNWPPESERAALCRLCSEVPLQQRTLMRLIFMGITKEVPVSPGEAFELVEQLVRRACALPPEDSPLQLDQLEIADYIFQLCQYHHPDNITLPAGYTAPSLAITSLYWRGWLLLVMMAAHNPHSFATPATNKYPTLRALLECCITNKFTADWGIGGDCEAEKAAILQLETHLATASNAKLPITEHTSRLLSQLTMMDPLGPARRPPPAVCEALQQQSSQLRLARLLCRQPALLLDVVERHGTRKAMPWLQQLLYHSQLQLSVLPVQCLCEFLSAGGAGGAGGAGEGKAPELAAHLRRTVRESPEGALAVLQYYMQRLAHAQPSVRVFANRGLKLVLSQGPPEEINEIDWNSEVGPEEWLELVWQQSQWEAVRGEVVARVRGACLVECTPRHLAAYIAFLAKYVIENDRDDVRDVVLDLSQVLMERMSVMNAVLPMDTHTTPEPDAHATLHHLTLIFYTYLQRVREPCGSSPNSGGYEWCASQERVLLQWSGGEHCTMHVLVAHASVKLLCYGPSIYDINAEMYSWLVSAWVGRDAPQAFLVDTCEEALLLPDWLRLHLVRAGPPLLEAGLRGLNAPKLAVFIQTFGMPVASMSALLAALDACPAGAVLRLGVERPYMAQLLRVQHARGATGGHAFAATLRLTEPQYPPADTLFAEEELPAETEDAWGVPENFPASHVAPLLATAFLGHANYPGDVDNAFTLLNSKLSEEMRLVLSLDRPACPYTEAVVTWLQMSLTGASSPQVATTMLQRAPHSAPLLRTMRHASHGVFGRRLLEACEMLLKHYKCATGPLVSVLRDIVEARGSPRDVKREQDTPIVPSNATKDQLLAAFEASTANSLEELGMQVIRRQDTRLVVEVVTELLARSQAGRYERGVKQEGGPPVLHVLAAGGRGAGLLIDWMSELQPDTLGPNPQAQMRLMFRDGGAPWRPQLVTLLAHRASWHTLHNCLTELLRSNEGWSASAVLEFAQTVTRSPRVWQPRDKAMHPGADMLRLNYDQLEVLVRYVCDEGNAASEGGAGGVAAVRRRMEARLPLLLQCCADDAGLLAAALAAHHRDDMLALLLDMQVPKVEKLMASSGERGGGEGGARSAVLERAGAEATCATDRVSHSLLTAIAAHSQAQTRDNNTKLSRLDSGARALFARHWRAGARALPLCAALLRGRPPRVLAHLLSAVELTPPHILFSEDHTKEVESILECFLAVCRRGGAREAGGLVARTAGLLRQYAAAAPPRATAFLHKHRELIASVPALSSCGDGTLPASAAPPPQALRTLQQRHASADDLHWALQEVETWGSRRGGAWGGPTWSSLLLRAVAPLVHHPTGQVRSSALHLLPKLLPAVADTTPGLQAVLKCLESPQTEIVAGMLEKLPSLLHVLQEHASTVLVRVLELGVRARHQVDPCLTGCVRALNMYRGC